MTNIPHHVAPRLCGVVGAYVSHRVSVRFEIVARESGEQVKGVCDGNLGKDEIDVGGVIFPFLFTAWTPDQFGSVHS